MKLVTIIFAIFITSLFSYADGLSPEDEMSLLEQHQQLRQWLGESQDPQESSQEQIAKQRQPQPTQNAIINLEPYFDEVRTRTAAPQRGTSSPMQKQREKKLNERQRSPMQQ